MIEPREYLVRTPDGHDYGRDESLTAALNAADLLGDGATVIALNGHLLPIRENGKEKVVYTVTLDEATESIRCPYHRCEYGAMDMNDLEEHLISMPTEAPEHRWEEGDKLPKRVRRTPDGQLVRV